MHMKKKTIFILAISLTIACSLVFAACDRGNVDEHSSDISRITSSYLAGESDLFAVSLECGRRERAFIADGKVTDVAPFAELKILPLKTADAEGLQFVLASDDATLSGSIDKGTSGEFKTSLDLTFTPAKITVTMGEQSSEIDLSSVLEGAITAEEAIDIARETFKDKLELEAADGKSREVYLKLITGDRENYYYYVSFIGDGVNYLATLVSLDGNIVSKRG